MMSFSDDTQADIIVAFITTSKCLDVLYNINSAYSVGMVSNIYPSNCN